MASIEEAAEKLSNMENGLESYREKFSSIDTIETDSTVKESFLTKKIEPVEPGKVAGVDGGLLKRRYASGDVVATRAVATLFSFKGSSVEAEYVPSKNPEPDFHVYTAEDSRSLEKNSETQRLSSEIEVVSRVIETADQVLMDGSIVPSYLEDNKVLELYEKVFEQVESGQLAGVVEDSYGLKLANILEDKLDVELGRCRDTLLMEAILDEGERSFVRRYSDSPVEHPVLRELEDRHVNRIHTFYVKLSSLDLPLRVDYLGSEDEADRIAGLLYSLKSSERYTVPSPVLEADKRAKISRTYLKRLEKRFSPGLQRRDRRIF